MWLWSLQGTSETPRDSPTHRGTAALTSHTPSSSWEDKYSNIILENPSPPHRAATYVRSVSSFLSFPT